MSEALAALDVLVAQLKNADWKSRDALKEQLVVLANAFDDHATLEEHFTEVKKSLSLELRWELDEVLERSAPPPEVSEEPEEEEAPKGPLTAEDLNLVYQDPRGLVLHKSKVGERWFATQKDPRSGQPQTFELQDAEISQLKIQLNGSPYWVANA